VPGQGTGAVPKYSEQRVQAMRAWDHEVFGGDKLPVPIEAIAEDLLGLIVEERELDGRVEGEHAMKLGPRPLARGRPE
jgi:hypothetical protein